MNDIAEKYRNHLKHMLGVERHIPKNSWGYRNTFAACPNTSDYFDMVEMEKKGLVLEEYRGKTLVFYKATELGCKTIKLTKKQIKRALEP